MEARKKSICILSNDLKRGGTDTFIINLIKELKEDYDITLVLSINKNRDAIREKDIINDCVNVIKTADLNNTKGILVHLICLYRILSSSKFDVFQTNIDLFNGLNLFIAWVAGVKIRVCHSHNSRNQKELVLGKTISVRIYQFIMKKLCWYFSNRRCGCSKDAMDFLYDKKWKGDRHSYIINNGIDIDLFKKNYDVSNIKRELGLNTKYNVLTVGRIDEQKNPLFMVEIFKSLCDLRDDCDLIWVGEGKLENKVKELVIKYNIENRVHMLGVRSDIPELMNCCDVFLFPSAFEGLGIVLIEAQAASLPCIVSDVVPREADCGGCTFLSLNDSAESWGKKISNVLDGSIILKVDENKLNKFSIQNMADQMRIAFE